MAAVNKRSDGTIIFDQFRITRHQKEQLHNIAYTSSTHQLIVMSSRRVDEPQWTRPSKHVAQRDHEFVKG